jgi:hypothetical protein
MNELQNAFVGTGVVGLVVAIAGLIIYLLADYESTERAGAIVGFVGLGVILLCILASIWIPVVL